MLHLDSKYCWAWDRAYIKANGRVPCWCNAGEKHTIINKSLDTSDFMSEIINSPEMREMRTKILRDGEYYIPECGKCCCMIESGKKCQKSEIKQLHQTIKNAKNKLDKLSPDGSINHLTHIQAEPSFPCNLKCPGCLQGKHKNPLKTEDPPYIMPLKWYENILNSIVINDSKVDRISFVGRGEPTLNKELPLMIMKTKELIPSTTITMDTNSNQEFKKEYSYIDRLHCSIDGSTQDSYDKYRIRGNFDKAVKFMEDGVKHNANIVWKYILFNTTDSIELLNKAQQIAKDTGIQELRFIITNCPGGSVLPSKKYRKKSDVENYIKSNRIFKHTYVSYAA